MSQAVNLSPGKPDAKHNVRAFQKTGKPLTFDDLVVDGSLTPVEVKLLPSKMRKSISPNDDLLIELQCEV